MAINCWVVLALYLILQVFLGYSLDGMEILGNISFLRISYNGAWWFIFTYIILILLAPMLEKAMEKKGILTAIIIMAMYCTGYLLKFKIVWPQRNCETLKWFLSQYGNLGFSIFPYWLGMLFAKMIFFAYISSVFAKIKSFKVQKGMLLGIILIMFIGHGVVQTAAVSPVTGVVTLCVFNLWLHECKESGIVHKIFDFLGKHSTNIWLCHMFVMDYMLCDGKYIGKYPLVILALVLSICIGISYVVCFFTSKLNLTFDKTK